MKSKFKHLVVSGCSFTTNEHVPDNSAWNWPNVLAQDTDMQIHNLAHAAAGNEYISNSIVLYLEQTKLDPSETLVFAMWSGIGRIDWLVDPLGVSNFTPYSRKLNDYVDFFHAGNWWNTRSGPLTKVVADYAKYQNNHTYAVSSWLAMKHLETFTESNGYTYYCTSFLNYSDSLIKGDALTVPFFDVLTEMGLDLNQSHWLKLDPCDHFGNWCRDRNLLCDDDFHPGQDGPQRWPREVLIPLLQEKGVLYE